MNEQYLEIIESISNKFNNIIKNSDIIDWLNNFQKADWDKALIVLNQVEYFSINDIIREYDLLFESLINSLEEQLKQRNLSEIISSLSTRRLYKIHGLKDRVILHPIGEFAKSGSTMFYFLKQTTSFKRSKDYIRIVQDPTKLEKYLQKDSIIILVDDILGSGKSLTDYYDYNIATLSKIAKHKSIKVYVLCLIYLLQSLERINKKHKFKIYGNLRYPAFSQSHSVFGYRPKMLEIRKFCYGKGIGLFRTFDRKKNEFIDHPLGYNNSQALVVFQHSVPNNTLPIIWSNKAGGNLYLNGSVKIE